MIPKASKNADVCLRWELSVAYIINKLSACSIQDSNHQIPMDYVKFHIRYDMMLLLSTGRSDCQQNSHRLNYCSCIEQQHSVSMLKLSCLQSVCGGLHSCWRTRAWHTFACFSVDCNWLLALHQGRRSRRLNIRLVNWQRQATVSGIIHTSIFCI